MSTTCATAKRAGVREKPLLAILLAGFIGMLLAVAGGLVAQHRNINQYASAQASHQIDWITNHPEPYDPSGETPLADWVADKVRRSGPSRTDMVFVVDSTGADVAKLGTGVPELAQSGLLLDASARTQILTPGEGRVASNAGDFYHRTVNFNVQNETVTLASLVYLGGLEEVESQSRISMTLIGLGGFLLLALVAGNLLGGKLVVEAGRVRDDDGGEGDTRSGHEGESENHAGQADVVEQEPITEEVNVAPTEIRASGIWADEDESKSTGR